MESSNEQHLVEIEVFCNIMHVFIVTFDQFNASLVNTIISFFLYFFLFQKKKRRPVSYWKPIHVSM